MRWCETIAGVARTFEFTDEQIDVANMAMDDYRGHQGVAVAATRHVLGLPLTDCVALVNCARQKRRLETT